MRRHLPTGLGGDEEDRRRTLQPGPSRDKERCSAESSERSSLATTPEPRRDRLGSLPTPRPRFPPPSIPTVGHLVAPGQTHSGNLSLCLIASREIKAVRVAWPMRRTASPGHRMVTLSGCPDLENGPSGREANGRAMLPGTWSEFDRGPEAEEVEQTPRKDLVTAPIRGCCALQGHNCQVSGRISMRPHPSGTTRITVQRSLGTAQRLANRDLGSTAGQSLVVAAPS
jgi:hypothetical protein